MAPALRVEAKKAPLCVARHLFGITKPRFSRLDGRFFSHNSGNSISDNRPTLGFDPVGNIPVMSETCCEG